MTPPHTQPSHALALSLIALAALAPLAGCELPSPALASPPPLGDESLPEEATTLLDAPEEAEAFEEGEKGEGEGEGEEGDDAADSTGRQRRQDPASEVLFVGPPMLTVEHLVRARTCSTEPTEAINIQLAAEQNCIQAGSFASISDIPNVQLGPAANPFLQADAAAALREVAATQPDETIRINSSWRSVLQQHILKQWRGRCGIRVVARPGTSNHESGLAMDLRWASTETFRDALTEQGWTWYCDRNNKGRLRGCNDIPHHEFRGEDLRRLNVLAFQRLWNHSWPDDPIPLSGVYDTPTERRMNRLPLTGFPAGNTCDTRAFVAHVAVQPEDRATTAARGAVEVFALAEEPAPPSFPDPPAPAFTATPPASTAAEVTWETLRTIIF